MMRPKQSLSVCLVAFSAGLLLILCSPGRSEEPQAAEPTLKQLQEKRLDILLHGCEAVKRLYENGRVEYLSVYEAERELFVARLAYADSRQDRIKACDVAIENAQYLQKIAKAHMEGARGTQWESLRFRDFELQAQIERAKLEADGHHLDGAQVENALRTYYQAMTKRDAQTLRTVLDPAVVMIEAGPAAAKLHRVDLANEKELLPPDGNDDWDDIQIKDVKVAIAPPLLSVAQATLTLATPATDKQVAQWETLLKESGERLSLAERDTIKTRIAERAISFEIFATLAKREGDWRIVCLSVPK